MSWTVKILGFSLLLLLSSCSENGCKDESAINYQVTATVDDGSCIYCKKDNIDKGALIFALIDNRPQSVHYQDQIAVVEAHQTSEAYNDGSCGQNGCFTALEIKSLVAEDIINLNFSVQFNVQGIGSFTQYFFQNAGIKSGETKTWEKAFSLPSSSCSDISNGSAQGNLFDATFL